MFFRQIDCFDAFAPKRFKEKSVLCSHAACDVEQLTFLVESNFISDASEQVLGSKDEISDVIFPESEVEVVVVECAVVFYAVAVEVFGCVFVAHMSETCCAETMGFGPQRGAGFPSMFNNHESLVLYSFILFISLAFASGC